MTPDLMNVIRQQLVRRLGELNWTACRTVSALKNDGGACADPMDSASIEHDRHIELTVRSKEYNEIREIWEALQRMDNGFFGICVVCGSPIADRRLLAEPMTRLCRNCQEREEGRTHHLRHIFYVPPPSSRQRSEKNRLGLYIPAGKTTCRGGADDE